MKRGEIWIASLEPKKGSEVGKQRPVVILQTDLLNDIGHPTVIIAPISSHQQKENILRLKLENSCLHKDVGYVLIDQLRAIDRGSRLKKKIGEIDSFELLKLSNLIGHVLDLK